MRRLLFVFIGLCLFAAPLPAVAQDVDREARLALAERAFQAMQADQMADQMMVIMQAVPQPELEGMTAAERLAFDEVMAEVMQTTMNRMFDGMTEVYADIYTYEELEALVVFYESPIGRSIMEKAALATPHIIELMNEILPDMMRQMVDGMCDRLECTAEERRMIQQEVLAQMGMVES